MMTNFTLTDLYSAEEITAMTLEEIKDVLHDIFGYYEDIRKDALNEYLKAFSESKES